ncbi:MAG: hypothetical protein QFC55_04390 [Chloroflexota bacterium]|nr:hypothetical protein [Chloroflexota bacterium]
MPKRRNNVSLSKVGQRRLPPHVSEDTIERPNLAKINLTATAGKQGLKVGDRVRIDSNGMYAGKMGVIERLSAGAIPSALVRVDGGGSRQVRTIDLMHVTEKG